jgi:hypothetical protein
LLQNGGAIKRAIVKRFSATLLMRPKDSKLGELSLAHHLYRKASGSRRQHRPISSSNDKIVENQKRKLWKLILVSTLMACLKLLTSR